ncbi:MAG: PEP-CTERM sorting domain-containing protein [Verrucomicrobiota bacterium]
MKSMLIFKPTIITCLAGVIFALGLLSSVQAANIDYDIDFWGDYANVTELRNGFSRDYYASTDTNADLSDDDIWTWERNSTYNAARHSIGSGHAGDWGGVLGSGEGFVYDPSEHNALEEVDATVVGRRGQSYVNVRFLLEQDGNYFESHNLFGGSDLWGTSHSERNLADGPLSASDFYERLSDGSTDENSLPDFGSNASPLTFGISYNPDTNDSTIRAYQSFSVTATPVPEPSTIVVFGLAGVLLWRRPRR